MNDALDFGRPRLNGFDQRRQAAAWHFHHRADIQEFVKSLSCGAEGVRRRQKRRLDETGFKRIEHLKLLSRNADRREIFRVEARLFQRD